PRLGWRGDLGDRDRRRRGRRPPRARPGLDVQPARPAAQPLGERVGPGRRAAPQALRPDPEPRRDGEGLRGARAGDVRRGDAGADGGAAGAGRRAAGAGREHADAGDRAAVRRRRGVPAAPRDRELPAAAGAAVRGRAADRDLAPGLQRHGAELRQRARDRPDERDREHVQLPAARVLPDGGRDARRAAGRLRAGGRPRGPAPARPAEQLSHRRALLAAAASLTAAAALAAPAGAADFTLPRADVAVTLAPDGSLLVREQLTETGFFHGMYRDIPLKRGESIDRIAVSEGGKPYARRGSTELGSIGEPATFNFVTSGKRVRVVWHFDASGEARTFTLSYRFRGVTKAYSDVAHMNLRVWGDQWAAGLDDLTASLRLPHPIPFGPSYRVWGHPPWVHGVVTEHRLGTTLRAVGVPAHQWVELRTVVPRSVLTSTAGAQVVAGPGLPAILAQERATTASYAHDRARLDDAKRHIGRTLLFLFLLG